MLAYQNNAVFLDKVYKKPHNIDALLVKIVFKFKEVRSMKKKLMALMLAFALTATLAACGDKGDDTTTTTQKQDKSEEASTETAEDKTEESSSAEKAGEGTSSESSQAGKSLKDATEEEDMGDYHVKINNAVVSTDSDGNPMLVVHYDFTNNSDEAQSAWYALYVEAYQDGASLDSAYAYDNPDYNDDNDDTKLQPGNTMEDCQCAFKLNGTSDVEINMYAYDDDYNKCYAKKTFSVE